MNPNSFSMGYKNLTRKSHAVGQNTHHIYWCTKYRYNMMRQCKYKNLLEDILRAIAREKCIEIISLTVDSNHVHLVASLPFSMSQSKALQLFKGGSSYRMFRANEHFRLRYRRGHFWSLGKFVWSVGDADLPTVVNYVDGHNHETSMRPRPKGRGLIGSVSSSPTVNFDLKDGVSTVVDEKQASLGCFLA